MAKRKRTNNDLENITQNIEHLAREKEADHEQHGGGQLHQSWRKWVFLWDRLSTLQREMATNC